MLDGGEVGESEVGGANAATVTRKVAVLLGTAAASTRADLAEPFGPRRFTALVGGRTGSLAVQVSVVLPTANRLPDAGTQSTGTVPLTASVALTTKLTVAPAGLVALARTSPGTVIIGPVVSVTVTANVPVAVFFAVSTAVQMTVLEPNGKVLPLTDRCRQDQGPAEAS